MIKDRNIDPGAFITASKIAFPFGVGEVFYVANSNEPAVCHWLEARVPGNHFFDATAASADVAIQAALDSCVDCRNDYVVVWPSNVDYDLTAALTMSKKSVHLVCPGGLGYDVGAVSSARLSCDATSATVINVNANNLEIAGFYFKNYVNKAVLDNTGASGTSWSCNIHHNWFAPTITSTTSLAIIASSINTNSWSYGRIERNKFHIQSDTGTIAKIIDVQAGAAVCDICHNDISLGANITATVGISNQAANSHTSFNVFSMNAGVFTNCIAIPATTASAMGNLGAVSTGRLMSGGVAGTSFVQNFDGVENVTLDGSVQS